MCTYIKKKTNTQTHLTSKTKQKTDSLRLFNEFSALLNKRIKEIPLKKIEINNKNKKKTKREKAVIKV